MIRLIGIIALMGKNGGGSIENLGEYGWWGNDGIFNGRKVGSSMGEIWKEWGNVLGCGGTLGKVWKDVLGVWGDVGSVLGCGKVWEGVGDGE